MTDLRPLLRAADFQTAWYYALLLFAVLVVTVIAFTLVGRQLAPMWRAGDRGLAAVVLAATTVTFLLLAAMLVQVVVALLPSAVGGIS